MEHEESFEMKRGRLARLFTKWKGCGRKPDIQLLSS